MAPNPYVGFCIPDYTRIQELLNHHSRTVGASSSVADS